MKQIFTSMFLLTMLLTHFQSKAQEAVGSLMFVSHMTGAEVVPPVTTSAEGLAVFILNSTHDTLCITVSLSGIDDITGIFVQEGLPDVQGAVVLDLSPYRQGNQVFANITGAALSTALIKNMLAGRYYVNAATPTKIDGIIRGQILPETNETYVVRLNGATVSPPNTSPGVGLGVFILSSNKKSIKFTVLARNLVGQANAVHMHTSLLGLAGPVAINLTPYLTGNVGKAFLQSTIDSTIVVDYPTFLLNLRAGFIYLDIHTDSYSNGELRGKMLRERNIGFYTTLSPQAEIPPVTSSLGQGLAYCSFNATFDTLRYDAVTGGLSGTPLHARIRAGNASTPYGPILTDLDYGLQGDTNILTGYASDTSINLNLLRNMLSGNAYLNIATINNPLGEMRGQLKTTQRTGFSYRMTGSQEVPADTSSAYGSGFLSTGPDSTDARFKFLYGGLSSPATGAHFHLGGFGQLGPVVFNVTDLITNNNFVQGNFTLLDTIDPFTAVLFRLLNHDSLYLNMRTLQYPNGEIRGQLVRGLICNLFATDTTAGNSVQSMIDYNRELNVYPNPSGVDQMITARYVSPSNATGLWLVYDMTGKKIMQLPAVIVSGTNHHSIDMDGFAPGVYSVQLTIDGKHFTQNIVKQ